MSRFAFHTMILLAGIASGCGTTGGNGNGDAAVTDDATTMAGDAWLDPDHLPDGAPNPCLGATTCDECTSRTPCGWCNGQCRSGSVDHSDDLMCSGDTWMWRGVQCPGSGAQCGTHTDCSSCAMDENSCGWCANTHQCVAGDPAGPATTVDGCNPTAGNWIYNTMQMTCPP